MIFIIMAIWLGYKRAKANGRDPFLWAFICAVVYGGLQLLTTFFVRFFMKMGVELWGWPASAFDDHTGAILIAAIVVSFIGLLGVLRYLDRIPEDETVTAPPPPPSFDER